MDFVDPSPILCCRFFISRPGRLFSSLFTLPELHVVGRENLFETLGN